MHLDCLQNVCVQMEQLLTISKHCVFCLDDLLTHADTAMLFPGFGRSIPEMSHIMGEIMRYISTIF